MATVHCWHSTSATAWSGEKVLANIRGDGCRRSQNCWQKPPFT
ncbi:hypothetical protein ACFEO6_004750 [Salmonella enterica]